MTLMTEQRGRAVSLYGQTVAMAAIMEELSERNERARSGSSGSGNGGAASTAAGVAAASGGKEGAGSSSSSKASLLAAATGVAANAAAPPPATTALTAADNDAGLPPLLLAPPFAPGITMTAPPPSPNTPPNLIDDDFFGMRLAEIPDWIGATFALEARWGKLEALEEAARERVRLSEEWAPPAELRERLLLGEHSAMLDGIPDGEPGGCGHGRVDPLMRLMEGVLPGVDDAEFRGSEEEEEEDLEEEEEE